MNRVSRSGYYRAMKKRLYRIPTTQQLALLGALSLFMATIEFLFPKPLPYMRIGLANIPLLIALRLYSFRSIVLLVFLKVVAQGLLHGTFASYIILFSICGSVSSVMVMLLIERLCSKYISMIGISICGAITSGMVQSLLAIYFIFGEHARVLLPINITISIIGGVIVGIISQLFWKKSKFVALLRHTSGPHAK